MPLNVGSQLGPYTLVAAVGAGGMGEVYRARDGKLQRDVALKILPAHFVGDADRLARFRREAQALATFSHSNIAAIFDFRDDPASPFLVMEFVQGETLAHRLAHGRLQPDDAIAIAKQIAEALSAAHEKGIIHRDLKPANVKITPEGTVKVLDFGLAKVFSDERPVASLSNSPTMISAGASMAGTILGTAAYMSPEQARGKPVDKRTDVWAFGVVLYEMLAGRPPFEGETVTEVLGAIMHKEPDWTRLPGETPAPLVRVLRGCLRKDLRQRTHDINDARIELEAGDLAPAAAPLAAGPAWPRAWWLAAAALAAGAVLGAGALRLSQRAQRGLVADVRPPMLRASIDLPSEAPLALGADIPGFGYNSPTVSVSPDGAWLAYVGQSARARMVYVREMSSGDVRAVPGTEGAIHPFFSPDSQWIGFLTTDHVKKIPRQGGTSISLCEADTPVLAWWTDTGSVYFTENETYVLSRVSQDGGRTERVLATADVTMTRFADVLPDGRHVLAEKSEGIGGEFGGIYLVDIQTRETKLLLRPGYAARYAAPGHLLFARAGNLMAAKLDPDRGQVIGEPVTLAAGVAAESLFGILHASASSGLAAFVPGSDLSAGKLAWVDRQGAVEYLDAPERVYGALDLTADDARLAVQVADVNDYLWVWDTARREGRRVVNMTAEGMPSWSRDGRQLAGRSASRAGAQTAFVHDVEANGAVSAGRPFDDIKGRVTSWSPLGDVVAVGMPSPNHIEFVSPGKSLKAPSFGGTFADFSPDGRWLAYQSSQTGTAEISIRSYPDGKVVGQVSTGGGVEPRWKPSGELFYRSGRRWFSTHVTTDPQPRWDPPRVAFESDFIDTPGISYDVSRDGRRLLVVVRARPVSQSRIGLVVNWTGAVK